MTKGNLEDMNYKPQPRNEHNRPENVVQADINPQPDANKKGSGEAEKTGPAPKKHEIVPEPY